MPAPPASQMPLMSRFGAGAALVFGALMAPSGNPGLFHSCARAAAGCMTADTTIAKRVMCLTSNFKLRPSTFDLLLRRRGSCRCRSARAQRAAVGEHDGAQPADRRAVLHR